MSLRFRLYKSIGGQGGFGVNQTGTRVQCQKCGSQALISKGGEGTVKCCGEPMVPAGQPATKSASS